MLQAHGREELVELFQNLASLQPEINLLVFRLYIFDADLVVME